jgi:DNA-binding CsgD family transcriptional regulator/PAS domain-containing protein
MSRTEIYNDFMVPFDIEHGLFGVVDTGNSRWASISLYRDTASTPFEEPQGEIVRFLVPHIQRAFKLHSQISELKAHSDGLEAALNMMSAGVIFLDAHSEVRLMNSRAEELVKRKDGLLLSRGRLSASVQSESAALRTMVAGATRTGNGTGFSAGGTILISRTKGRPISVTVAPLREFNPTVSQQPAAVLFISDPDQRVEVPFDMLQRCYGLTPAEARLAMVLLEGQSLKQASETCSVTHNTAKSQLKSVFWKTDVKRQGELIRLLLNSASIRRPRH